MTRSRIVYVLFAVLLVVARHEVHATNYIWWALGLEEEDTQGRRELFHNNWKTRQRISGTRQERREGRKNGRNKRTGPNGRDAKKKMGRKNLRAKVAEQVKDDKKKKSPENAHQRQKEKRFEKKVANHQKHKKEEEKQSENAHQRQKEKHFEKKVANHQKHKKEKEVFEEVEEVEVKKNARQRVAENHYFKKVANHREHKREKEEPVDRTTEVSQGKIGPSKGGKPAKAVQGRNQKTGGREEKPAKAPKKDVAAGRSQTNHKHKLGFNKRKHEKIVKEKQMHERNRPQVDRVTLVDGRSFNYFRRNPN